MSRKCHFSGNRWNDQWLGSWEGKVPMLLEVIFTWKWRLVEPSLPSSLNSTPLCESSASFPADVVMRPKTCSTYMLFIETNQAQSAKQWYYLAPRNSDYPILIICVNACFNLCSIVLHYFLYDLQSNPIDFILPTVACSLSVVVKGRFHRAVVERGWGKYRQRQA